ncbi:MAG: hypothetical protein QF780_07970 [Candidatus Marinimicrobia bacterium]|mgnify:FL=1|jgi:Flp pilus assembly protein TadD|nr:hypothetical protein [Candidatus Neomarinimicrobiota bacterium]
MRILSLILITGILIADNSDSLLKATAALNAGMFEEALLHIKKAQSESPTSPDVHQMKALLHEALHEPKEALGSWKKCLKYSKDKKVKREAKIHIRILSEE